MANIPSALVQFNASNVAHLRACCLRLIASKGEKQSSLAAAAGNWSDGDFSNWLRDTPSHPRNLTPDRYFSLLQHVANRDGIEPENFDEVFAGVARFLGHPMEDTFNRVADFAGSYVVYRYSLLAPGYVLRGSLEILPDDARKALRTSEFYRIQSEMLTRTKSPPEMRDLPMVRAKVRDLDFPRDGYFFPRSPDSYVMISKKRKKREHQPVEIQTIYFDNVYESTDEPGIMQGVLSDWHGDKFYTTRVVAQKLPQALGSEYVMTLDPKDVNDIVHAYLTAKWDDSGSVVSYP